MAQGQQLLLPLYLSQQARAGDSHHPRGPGTEDTWKSSGVGDNDTRCASVTLPLSEGPFWGPGSPHQHPAHSSAVLQPPQPQQGCRDHPEPLSPSILSFTSKSSLLYFLPCPGSPLEKGSSHIPALLQKVQRWCSKRSTKGSKQWENVFCPQLNFIPVIKNPEELETKPEQPLHGHGEGVESSLGCHGVNSHLSTVTFILLANPFFPKFLLARKGWRKPELPRQHLGTSIIMWCDKV